MPDFQIFFHRNSDRIFLSADKFRIYRETHVVEFIRENPPWEDICIGVFNMQEMSFWVQGPGVGGFPQMMPGPIEEPVLDQAFPRDTEPHMPEAVQDRLNDLERRQQQRQANDAWQVGQGQGVLDEDEDAMPMEDFDE